MALTKEALAQVLANISPTLRALSAENAALKEENVQLKEKTAQVELAEEVIDMMDQRGLGEAGIPRKQKVAQLLASEKDLGLLKKAMEMRAPDMSFSSVSTRAENQGGDRFEDYILGGG